VAGKLVITNMAATTKEMIVMIFDSHAHYDDEAFDEDREEVLDKIQKAGVARALNCGADISGSEKTLKLIEKYDFIYGAVGVHPESCDEVAKNINKIGDMLRSKKVVALGEIGLDYYYDNFDRDLQIKAFKEQMDIARALNYPVIIHDRDAHEDTLNVIKEFKDVRGVLHCYSGTLPFAREILKFDYHLGFTGVVTFKNAAKAVEVVKNIPFDRILVETDCPYMAPVPHRGERNDSSYLVHVINKIAELRGMSYDEVMQGTYKNACEFLGL